MTKPGLTLIELILAIFISSLISVGLYQMINQVQKGIGFITRIIETDSPIMPFYSQLEKDITGMFTPSSSLQFYIKQEEQKNENKSDQDIKLKEANSKKEKSANAKNTDKPKEAKIDNVFFISKKENNLFISFITTGAIQPFDKKQPNNNTPFVRRVAYILEKDPMQPNVSRVMYRYSASNLDLKAIEKPDFKPSYEILGYIKNLSLDFVVFEPKEEKDQKKDAGQSKPIAIEQWNESEIWNKYKTLIPAYITIKGTLTDKLGKNENNFEFQFKVLAYQEYKKQEKSVLERLDKWAAEKLPGLFSDEKQDNQINPKKGTP